MRLEIGSFEVEDVVFERGAAGFERGVLRIDPTGLERRLLEDDRLARVTVSLAKPGERVRIVHALDAVEPRVRVAAGRSAFPGMLGLVEPAGRGRLHRLAGVAVLQTVDEFWVEGGLSLKEAIVDMWGPGAPYSPFSATLNVVVSCGFRSETGVRERTAAVTRAALLAGELLAEPVRGLAPDRLEVCELPRAALPRVGYLCFLMVEGEVHQSYVYGVVPTGLPTILHPNEVLGGAVVSGDFHTACFRNVTYLQQNNSAVRALMARHGRDVDFAGVIVARALAPDPQDKQRIAQHAATLAEVLGLEGVVISQDSGGNATVDLMLACRELERRGIKTVLLAEEFAGADGGDFGLVHTVPEADAIVSTGNRDAIVELPAADRAVGGDRILNPDLNDSIVDLPAASAFPTAIRRFLCATNQVGSARLTTRPC
jgi:glycine reductase complex component B subunit alpha and beta